MKTSEEKGRVCRVDKGNDYKGGVGFLHKSGYTGSVYREALDASHVLGSPISLLQPGQINHAVSNIHLTHRFRLMLPLQEIGLGSSRFILEFLQKLAGHDSPVFGLSHPPHHLTGKVSPRERVWT